AFDRLADLCEHDRHGKASLLRRRQRRTRGVSPAGASLGCQERIARPEAVALRDFDWLRARSVACWLILKKCTIAWAPHRGGSCMSGEGTSTLAHRMFNGGLRTSRRRFLTQVGAAGLGIGVPVSMTMAQETQRSLVGDGKEVSLG